jgi:predicted CXXCH cytochrome family protein
VLGLGDFAGMPDEQGRIKSDVALEAMKAMDYDALVIGEREMALGDDFIFKNIKKSGIPLVETNLKYGGKQVGDRDLILKRGGLKIGLLGVTLDQTRAGQEEWAVQDPFKAVEEALPKLREKVDLVVVMSHIGYRQSVALAEQEQGIDVVLVSHQGRRVRTPVAVGGAIMTQAGDKGKYLGRLNITYDRQQKKITDYSGELISLDTTIPEDEKMAKLYADYQAKVKDMVKGQIQGRQGKEVSKPTDYMGSVWCRSCHAEIFEKWNATPHAQAFLTLKRDHEEYNPECIGCHVTGYKEGGFVTIDETPAFSNVQCEACHGPGSRHVADKGQTALKVQDEAVCQACHTGDRGVGFNYRKMKGQVH